MDQQMKISLLQRTYASALVDSADQFSRNGITDKVLESKNALRNHTARAMNSVLKVTEPQEVFTKLGELFGCADWKVEKNNSGFTAVARGCMMCAIAKKSGAASPCRLYCLDPMESIVKACSPEATYKAESTLYDGDCCRVKVGMVE